MNSADTSNQEISSLVKPRMSTIQRYTEEIYNKFSFNLKVVFAISTVAVVVYIITGLSSYMMGAGDIYTLLDYVFVFSLLFSLIVDGFYSLNVLNDVIPQDPTAKTRISLKVIVYIAINIFYIAAYTGKTFWLNAFHNVVAVISLSLSATIQEFILAQLKAFSASFFPLHKYDDTAIYTNYSELAIYNKLQDYTERVIFFASMNSITLPILISLTIVICINTTLEETASSANQTVMESKPNSLINYISHYFMIFLSIEGSIRRASMYNDLMAEISHKINYRTNRYITIFGVRPIGLLLFSYYLSFLVFMLRYVI
jgi:hypothetical protein